MSLPSATDPRWRDVVLGNVTYDFDFLAIQFFLGRIGILLAHDRSERKVAECIDDFRQLLTKNAHLPSAKRDIAKMFGGVR
jgi:hypothetical protein